VKIYELIKSNTQQDKKMLAVLIDPDRFTDGEKGLLFIRNCEEAAIDFFYLGGSLLTKGDTEKTLNFIKKHSGIPVILFPGDIMQVSERADALLFLSLISGRNADLLIGKHVAAAPFIKKANLETIATGYMLIDCGEPTTVSYISQTFPIPYHKPEIAVSTAMAGEMLGMKMIYADGGSGASKIISLEMIHALKSNISVPLVIGGGIKTPEEAMAIWKAGADIIVIGTSFENNPEMIASFKTRK
jgi:phosphoglycerol geranylgeranyltransferase